MGPLGNKLDIVKTFLHYLKWMVTLKQTTKLQPRLMRINRTKNWIEGWNRVHRIDLKASNTLVSAVSSVARSLLVSTQKIDDSENMEKLFDFDPLFTRSYTKVQRIKRLLKLLQREKEFHFEDECSTKECR